ncbi:MAG TPA: YbaB/EbfC family nucleoid-associated protein [Candidatus Polarisedimenticolia bacterium]|jgi:DNA-binding YbaB/EbfC family protein|nr:YbaB/EbfC family nucleoid-associated protein [Candidatus Polarisedimenticolia bacterium]
MDMRLVMKQAQKMQEKMQKEIAEISVEGSAGGGMVTVTMTGNHGVTAVRIKPDVVAQNDVEMLEDLVRAALSDANRRVEDAIASKMSGMRLPPGLGF